jgi:hypothetical protein
MDECDLTRVSTSASHAPQSSRRSKTTRQGSSLTPSSVDCTTTTAGEHWVNPHFPALPECRSGLHYH